MGNNYAKTGSIKVYSDGMSVYAIATQLQAALAMNADTVSALAIQLENAVKAFNAEQIKAVIDKVENTAMVNGTIDTDKALQVLYSTTYNFIQFDVSDVLNLTEKTVCCDLKVVDTVNERYNIDIMKRFDVLFTEYQAAIDGVKLISNNQLKKACKGLTFDGVADIATIKTAFMWLLTPKASYNLNKNIVRIKADRTTFNKNILTALCALNNGAAVEIK